MMRISYPSELNTILVLIVISAWWIRMFGERHNIEMHGH